jgi:hypothetical protein
MPDAEVLKTKMMIKVPVVMGAIAILTAGASARAEIIDRVLAVVAGQPITLSDVNAASSLKLVIPDNGRADPIAGVLDRLIQRTLILGEVDRYQPPEPAPEEIERRYAGIVQRAAGEDGLRHVFTVTGFTADQLRRWIRDDLRTETYFNQRFGTTDPARGRMIDDWVRGLRRRADVTVLYVTS